MPLTGIRALVIDAEPSNAKLMVVILRADGADARSAFSAESALPLLSYFRPQLVITEMHLPGMSGLELARHLREVDSTVTIVVVTSRNGPTAEEQAKAAGADAYVLKPIDPVPFVAGLDKLLNSGGKT